MGTIAIVGMGPLLGLGVARKFGAEGYKVAMIARNPEALRAFEVQLRALGVDAAGFAADASDPGQVSAAFAAARDRFGEIDVLEFSPTQWNKGSYEATNALATTVESARHDIDLLALGAISCAREVIPGMIARKSGALFFTTGYSAIKPIPFITSLCLANSAMRSYAYCLQEELAPHGVYVGTVSINAFIADGTAADPLTIADLYWDMLQKRDRIEEVFGPT
jgi:NAD(P)-dependent dehydrogenase (short-subunit alcohol dehydrogenase family)